MRLAAHVITNLHLFKRQSAEPAAPVNAQQLHARITEIVDQFPPGRINRFARRQMMARFGETGEKLAKRLPAPMTFEEILSGRHSYETINHAVRDRRQPMRKARAAQLKLDRIVKDGMPEFGFTRDGWKNFAAFVKSAGRLIGERQNTSNPDIVEVNPRKVSKRFLNRLIGAEQVHPIIDRIDLQRRLGEVEGFEERRRIYAWRDKYDRRHSALIMIQAAFVNDRYVSDNVQSIKEGTDPTKGPLNTAVFYTISNWFLVSSSIGQNFIYAVVDFIQKKSPYIENFYTLSPMQKFREWVEKLDAKTWENCSAASLIKLPLEEFKHIAETVTPEQLEKLPAFKKDLQTLAAIYTTCTTENRGRTIVYDQTGNFHLGNGARVERINWAANTSDESWKESWGLMVNYRYSPEPGTSLVDYLEANKASYKAGHAPRSVIIDAMLGRQSMPAVVPTPVASRSAAGPS